MSLEQTAKQMRRQYMTTSDKYCDKHQRHYVKSSYRIASLTLYRVMPSWRASQTKRNQGTRKYEREQEQKRLYFLKDFSLLDDDLKNASFDNYNAATREQKEDLKNVRSQLRGYLDGQAYNVVLIGDTGVGKSHLAYSALKALSDHTKKMGLFINIVDLLAKIKEILALKLSISDAYRRLNG